MLNSPEAGAASTTCASAPAAARMRKAATDRSTRSSTTAPEKRRYTRRGIRGGVLPKALTSEMQRLTHAERISALPDLRALAAPKGKFGLNRTLRDALRDVAGDVRAREAPGGPAGGGGGLFPGG
jgi:hypothetical protein